MPLRLDIRRELTARSDRIKSVDLHPSEPWVLCSLYSGHVHVWNTQSQVSSISVSDIPIFFGRHTVNLVLEHLKESP